MITGWNYRFCCQRGQDSNDGLVHEENPGPETALTYGRVTNDLGSLCYRSWLSGLIFHYPCTIFSQNNCFEGTEKPTFLPLITQRNRCNVYWPCCRVLLPQVSEPRAAENVVLSEWCLINRSRKGVLSLSTSTSYENHQLFDGKNL